MSAPEGPPLELEAITKTFGKAPHQVHAVRDVSLSVAAREILAIVGPSGSGKTTLLSVAGCLLRPTHGEVRILGRGISGLSQADLARIRRLHIGFVFQAFNLIQPLTVRENVELPLNLAGSMGAAARDRATELLELLGIDALARRHPRDLSGGEQQRLAVARALANRPELILADEPTASLDSRSGYRVMELMRHAVDAGHARALVVVTHDTRILDLAHRVLYMEDGAVATEPPS